MENRFNKNTKGSIGRSVGILFVLFIMILGCFFLMRKVSESAETTNRTKNGNTAVKKVAGIRKLPAGYGDEIAQSGELHEIAYRSGARVTAGRTVKRAMVYTPYGYDKNEKRKRYNVFYLMHGYGGNHQTFLGSKMLPRTFKNILDNMTAKGDIAPTIVVSMTYTGSAGYYASMDDLGTEAVKELAPIVESKYRTYADRTDRAGLVKSRAHRAIGGFSMGGCSTWMALKNNADCFKYYLPISMPMYYDDGGYVESLSLDCARRIAAGANAVRGGKKVYVFAASGSRDFMNKATKKQAEDLTEYRGFKLSPGEFDKGNVIFHSWKGHRHSYKASFPYLYNGLIRFFGRAAA